MHLRLNRLPAWIISLNRSDKRWGHCFRSVSTFLSAERINRIIGIDPLDLAIPDSSTMQVWRPEVRRKLQAEGLIGESLQLEPLQAALCLSHQRALHAFLETGERWGLIFEDDVFPNEQISNIFTCDSLIVCPSDAEILLLYNKDTSNNISTDQSLRWTLPSTSIALKAYIVSVNGARKILAAWRPIIINYTEQLRAYTKGLKIESERELFGALLGKNTTKKFPLIVAYCAEQNIFQSKRAPIISSLKLDQSTSERQDDIISNEDVKNFHRKTTLLQSPDAHSCPPLIEYSFCITCMGLTEYIKLTLASNLEIVRTNPACELVLLNYNSPDGLHEYIMDHWKDPIAKGLLKYHYTQLPREYSEAKAKNLIHKLARGTTLINLDANHLLTQQYVTELRASIQERSEIVYFPQSSSPNVRGAETRIAYSRKVFEELGGYNELLPSQKREDSDLIKRAERAKIKSTLLAPDCAKFINITNDHRTKKNISLENKITSPLEKTLSNQKSKIESPWRSVPEDLKTNHNLPEVTLIVANWRRPSHLKKVFDSAPPHCPIFLLDNAHTEYQASQEDIRRADWYLKSNNNNLWLRWVMASQATTEFFCVHDDDLILQDWEPYLDYLRNPNNEGLTGPMGVRFKRDDLEHCYSKAFHTIKPGMYDLICGRITFGRVKDLQQKVRLFGPTEHNNIAEDIAVASGFKTQHFVPDVPDNIIELGSPFSSYSHYAHTPNRQKSTRALFFSNPSYQKKSVPHFSFCITCRGQSQYIKKTLSANLKVIQERGDCELVLVNYNSADGLDEYIIANFKKEIKSGLLRYAKTELPTTFLKSHSKNIAHKLGSGDYLINLEVHQYLSGSYIEALYSAFDDGAEFCVFVDNHSVGGVYGSIAIRREIFYTLGGYDEDPSRHEYEDMDFVQRVIASGSIRAEIDPKLTQFTQGPDHICKLAHLDRTTESTNWEKPFKTKLEFTGSVVANKNKNWGDIQDLIVTPNGSRFTIILTNYKRPHNLSKILDSINDDVDVFLLDNAPSGYEASADIISRTKWYVKSDGNDLAMRWMMISRARTKFYCVQSDDIIIKDYEPYLNHASRTNALVGPFGVVLNREDIVHSYSHGDHSLRTGLCDIIKSRAIFGKVSELRKHLHSDLLFNVNEDIFISALFNRKHHALHIPNNVLDLRSYPHKSASSIQQRDIASRTLVLSKPTQKSTFGVVLCASPRYEHLALQAISSIEKSNPDIPVYCHPCAEGFSSRKTKLMVDIWSPFEKTLYIDCDTVVCEDLMPVFSLFEKGSLFFAKERFEYQTLGEVINHVWIREQCGPRYVEELELLNQESIYWNSGVMLFEKTEAVHTFFKAWRARWELRGSKTQDQLPLLEVILEQGLAMELPSFWHHQLCPQYPEDPLPKAAIYHFMGPRKDMPHALAIKELFS